jgi:hypothetical protein
MCDATIWLTKVVKVTTFVSSKLRIIAYICTLFPSGITGIPYALYDSMNYITVTIDQAPAGTSRYIYVPAKYVSFANGFTWACGEWGTYKTVQELAQIPGAFFPK